MSVPACTVMPSGKSTASTGDIVSTYSAEIERISDDKDHPDQPIKSLVVSVYGDLPRPSVSNRTRNAILRAAGKVAVLHGVPAYDWEEIKYRVSVNNGQERHTVTFTPGITGITPSK